ncbi:Tad domain-containing protein [Paeniglutamicibacter psychrophenolicus]|uniref:Putative Flp pilus-assembly TadG-like N-terminal domain-containing protein n=1 Tax=Paeniglutamicibacter psychrophenolicus TaxID=257454 RepID=A0ABS4WKF2_9MICC|nr:Tad domain-containing protein [Paeniglutamicibacter psychrophenolicus]MBP2376044.1 hypothetical protein [Paeniglutamicibacter psychrophenolicus]
MKFEQKMSSKEDGISSVLVAIMLVVLLGFAAISIDVGKLYWEKAQLQNGADTSALSIAAICAKDFADPLCVPESTVAQLLANRNANDVASTVESVSILSNEVTVTTAASEEGAPANSISTWFAKILDPTFASSEVRASATAIWGPPKFLGTKFPLAFSQCEIDSSPTFDGNLQFLMSHGVDDKDSKKNPDACHSTSSGHEIPGGFGWLTQEPLDSCSVDTIIGEWEFTDVGNDFKDGCMLTLSKWKDMLEAGETVIAFLPVFDDVRGTGAGGEFKIYSYAAIEIHGWHFKNDKKPEAVLDYQPPAVAKVIKDGDYKNSDLGFVGRFIRYVFDDEDASGGGGTDHYGAGVVRLSN